MCRATETLRRSTLALAAVLLIAGGHASAYTQVNADLMPPAPTTSGESYDAGQISPESPAGVFSFQAKLCNHNGAGALGDGLESNTWKLTNGNALLNRESGTPSGYGSVLKFPSEGGYADRSLAPGECVMVPYHIGLQEKIPFDFFVNFVLADGVATCTQCSGLDCLLNSHVSACAAGKDVCTTTVNETNHGRDITRGCEYYASAQSEVTGQIEDCEDIEDHLLPNGTTCVFVCDGVAATNCNEPPQLIPTRDRLFAPTP